MDDIFCGYNWTVLTLLNAQHLVTNEENTVVDTFADTAYYQLGVKFVGETHVEYDGKSYMYNTGTLLYLPKETRDDIPYRRHIVRRGEGACIFFDSKYRLFPRPTVMPIANRPKIRELFYKVTDCYLREDQFAYMEAFYRLLMNIRDESQRLCDIDNGRSRTAPAVEYISRHLCDPYIDIGRLAELCGMSGEYFRHCFRRVYGVAPHQYISHQKINLAKKLLCDESCTIDELSRRMGFASCSYFARFFRERCGMSPTEYRKMMRI